MEYLTNETFKSKIFNYESKNEVEFKGDLPCIIDFYADWCGPCRMVSPILESLSEEYKGKINVYKIDTDKEIELAGAFGVSSIPTIMFVPKKGKPQVAIGALSKQAFVKGINEILLKDPV